MRKGQLFNSDIYQVLSKMGHTDQIAIGDAGLPIPDTTLRIDLALTYGEKVILATEIQEKNPQILAEIIERISQIEQIQNNKIEIIYFPHEMLKKQTHHCKAVIRTGECTPFANIILQSGVIF